MEERIALFDPFEERDEEPDFDSDPYLSESEFSPGEDEYEAPPSKSKKLTKKKEAEPPPLPPPPPKKGAPARAPDPPQRMKQSYNDTQRTATLSAVLNSSDLLQQKQKLRRIGNDVVEEASLGRKDLLDGTDGSPGRSFGHRDVIPWSDQEDILKGYIKKLYDCAEWFKSHISNSNVTVLDFSGTEQITDMFWFMLHRHNVKMKRIKRLNLNGCHRLTNTSISYITSIFNNLEYVELCGIKNLTEESMVHIVSSWQETIQSISVAGTNIGIIPDNYQGSIKMNGCPLVSPTELVYMVHSKSQFEKMTRPSVAWSTYKVVIIPDNTLPWSFLKVVSGEKDIKSTKSFEFKKNLSVNGLTVNMFEVPVNSEFVDVTITKGSIVIIPYLLAEDGPDQDYADEIAANLFQIFSTCPECAFVLVGMTSDTSHKVNTIADRYFNMISNLFRRKIDELNESLNTTIASKVLIQKMPAYVQQQFMEGQNLVKNGNRLLKINSDSRNNRDATLLISSMMTIPLDNEKYFLNTIKTASNALRFHFPWYFLTCHQELGNILKVFGSNNAFSLTSVEKITEKLNVPSNGLTNFSHHPNLSPFVAKMLELLNTMGTYLYYPDLNDGYTMSDYSLLKEFYHRLMTNKAPRKANWRCFGKKTSCWTKKDILEHCPDTVVCDALINLLMNSGILLQVPRDAWSWDLEDTFAYICVKDLPFYPTLDIEEIWPDGLPSDELEVERYFHFMPGMPASFFPCILSKCIPLGGIRLMWNKGIILQKGPITVLIEKLTSHDGTSVLFIGARMVGEGRIPAMLQGIFTIYRRIVQSLILKLHIYAQESAPCPTCHPPRNRYKTVNSPSGIWLINEREFSVQGLLQRNLTCQIDGSNIDPRVLKGSSDKMFPTHYYLGCLPGFSAYNRCLFCRNCAFAGAFCPGNLKYGKTSLNCSCDQEGQMCGDCGLCQRCVTSFISDLADIKYQFSSVGSIISLALDGYDPKESSNLYRKGPARYYNCPAELSPNYCPVFELSLVRGALLKILIKMGNIQLVYETGSGVITERKTAGTGFKDLSSQTNERWICKEGYRISVQLKFVEEDMDDMEILFYHRGSIIYRHKVSTQSCLLTIEPVNPVSFVAYTPRNVYQDPQMLDNFGEKATCSYNTESALLPSVMEANLLKGKNYIENALFQAGGVNYSGSTYITLPDINAEMLQYPSMKLFKEPLFYHLLCYTRSKIADVLSFGGTQAVPESWSVYRMIHLSDHKGFKVEQDEQKQLYKSAGILLLTWVFIFKMLPKINLPNNVSKLFSEELIEQVPVLQIDAGLHDLLDLSFWNLLTKVGINTNILSFFEESMNLLSQSQALIKLSVDRSDEIGLEEVQSKYTADNKLYLCPGHLASMRVEEGLTQVLPEIYGNYAIFLLSVDLPSNKISEIPENMFHALPNLAEFDCSNNFIEVLPDTISSCKKLYSLSLGENNLSELPETLLECKELFRIDINSNLMDTLPPVITKMVNLQRIYANNMYMTSLPEDIGNLVNLEKLYLNGNCLTSLPKSFVNLRSLNDLGLCGVPWLHISKSKKVMSYDHFLEKLRIWRLDRWLEAHHQEREKLFQFFDVDRNLMLDQEELGKLNAALFQIFPRFGYKGTEMPEDDMPSGFPMEVLECRNLEYLYIYYQGFVSVPPEIEKLQDLKILSIAHNPNLLSVAAEVGTISSLNRLEMDECPLLRTPPKEIRVKGFSTTFAYLRRLMSGSIPCKRTKLMMVGLGGAGKTSLVNSLLSKDGKADLKHGEAITDGIDISSWSVKFNEEQITYSVWDFAGQTVYYNTHQFFLSNRAVYLLLWNVRLGHEHAGLDFWLSSITVQAPKAPIFVIGSHIDQVSKFELPINEMKKRYKQIAGFHFVSSYTGQGIKELQNNLFDVTLQQQYMGEQIPEVWLTFEHSVIEQRSTTNVMEYSKLEKLANTSGIFDKSELTQAVQFLHELGSLQHFTTENLKSKVVVNPQWIVDVMACVVSVKNSPIKEGRLKHSDIATIWKDYPVDLHDWLLKLTEEYDLTFRLEDEPVNLVPCLLQEKAPDITWPEVDPESDLKENKLIYKFDYLPAGLFNRGQVRLHQISDSALIWKRGSYLKKNGHIALLLQTRDSELIVRVQGPRPENVIFLVHEVFEGLILESFRGVTYDYLIPCPDCLKMYVKDPHMFRASTIRRALEAKAPFLQCIKYFHTISCVDLLAAMPPDNNTDFDVHLVQSVRSLRDLRKDLSADIFMSYCQKDMDKSPSDVIHPEAVLDDLVTAGYKCWHPDRKKKHTIDEMARALSDASVFIAFISADFVKNEDCVNIFKYARLTLRKQMVVVAIGDGFEWKQSKLGLLLADEVFVNMTKSKKGVYKTKFDELMKTIAGKTNKPVGVGPLPSCFFSYTWVNSAEAVSLGTRAPPEALGFGDPRKIKEYLEDNGVKCWIDVERVGQNGLMDDIAEGLMNARLVVVCVSDEYAASSTCRLEFRYAANTLQHPIILAVVGTGSKWRMSEVGVLSLKYPIVSFQEKSDTAYTSLLSMVKEHMKGDNLENEKNKSKQNEERKNLSFQELFELAQRKSLRQISLYADLHDVAVYPRLFIVDFIKSGVEEDIPVEKSDDSQSPPQDDGQPHDESEEKRPISKKLSKHVSELKSIFRVQRYCVHTLCEHDEGWHSVCDPIQLTHDFGESLMDKYIPYMARMTAVMKYNKHFNFNCLQQDGGAEYMSYLNENPAADVSDYRDIYQEFRQLVIDSDSKRVMGKLARCRLTNGKIIWLCDKHRSSMKVTVLSSDVTSSERSAASTGSDNMQMVLGLRSGEYQNFHIKFTSSRTSKRLPDQQGNTPVKTDMYSTYELLPDKKMPKPKIMQKTKAKPDKTSKSNEADAKETILKQGQEISVEKSDLILATSINESKPDDNNQEINVETEKIARDTSFIEKKKDDIKPQMSAASKGAVADYNKTSSPGKASTSGLGEKAKPSRGTPANKSAPSRPKSSSTGDKKSKETVEKPKSKACSLM